MTLKYIENRIFRVILPSGQFTDVRIPIEETPAHLRTKVGLGKGYRVLYGSKRLPLNTKFSKLKVGRELIIKKEENNGMGTKHTSTAKGLHRHTNRQQKRSKHKLG